MAGRHFLLAAVTITLVSIYIVSLSFPTINFNYDFNTPPLPSIGIFVVTNDDTINEQEQHIASLVCYAYRHSYEFILIHPERYSICKDGSQSIFFQKPCLASMYLQENTHIKWLMVLDLDVIVLNMSKKIEPYIPIASNVSDIHVILYERFNGEVAAGNYLIHNHPWAHAFLAQWGALEPLTITIAYHNNDNGALHLHLLGEMVGNVSRLAYDYCFDIFKEVNEPKGYHSFIGCCKCALGGRWHFEHVRILRRGHSFVRDNLGFEMEKRIWSPTDFLLHGQKTNLSRYYSGTIDTKNCTDPEWKLPVVEDAIARNYTYVKEIIAMLDRDIAEGLPQSVGIADITNCWPHCTENATRRHAYVQAVCKKYYTALT